MIIFTYGSLMTGFHNNSVMTLAGGKRLTDFVATAKPIFDLINFGSFPALIHKPKNGFFISGELYDVLEEGVFTTLDFLEGHPDFYQRQTIVVWYGGVNVDVTSYIIPDPENYGTYTIDEQPGHDRMKRWT